MFSTLGGRLGGVIFVCGVQAGTRMCEGLENGGTADKQYMLGCCVVFGEWILSMFFISYPHVSMQEAPNVLPKNL